MDQKIRFLVPIAFSPQTEIIVEQACNLSKRYGAEVNMLYVLIRAELVGFLAKRR